MSTSTITLYKDSKINLDRNFKVDDLTAYLATLTSKAVAKMQYIRHGLNINVKIDMDQYNYEYINTYNYNYCSIVNSDSSRTCYYFIVNKRQVASSTIQLELLMDTINTFSFGTDYIISNKSKVLREHKDRLSVTKYFMKAEATGGNLTNIRGFMGTGDYDTYIKEYQYPVRILAPLDNSDNYIFPIGTIDLEVTDGGSNYDYVLSIGYYNTETGQWFDSGKWGTNIAFSSSKIVLTDDNGDTLSEIKYTHKLYNAKILQAYVLIRPVTMASPVYTFSSSVLLTNIITEWIYRLGDLCLRIMNLQSEGLSPILYKQREYEIQDNHETTWNLVYQTAREISEESSNPVTTYLIPNEPVKTFYNADINIFSGVASGKYQLFTACETSYQVTGGVMGSKLIPAFQISQLEAFPYQIKVTKGSDNILLDVYTEYEGENWDIEGNTFFGWSFKMKGVVVHNTGSQIDVQSVIWLWTYYNDAWSLESSRVEKTYSNVSAIVVEGIDNLNYYEDSSNITATRYLNYYYTLSTYTQTPTSTTTNSITNLDRTESTLIKVIALPYAPSNIELNNNNEIILPNEWKYDTTEEWYKLNNSNAQFLNQIVGNVSDPLNELIVTGLSIDTTATRNDYYESKLYHSDYYQPKFVYDSFSFIFQLDKVDVSSWYEMQDGYFHFNFKMTSTINSKWLFEFPYYPLDYSMADYDSVLVVARNNERTIYNSTYLNYLRTAYRYDLKALERQKTSSIVGLGLGIVGSIASVGLAIASGNPAVMVGAGLGAVSNITNSIINTANSIAQAEANQESKMEVMRNEAVSVAGSDDVDLLEYYSNNHAKMTYYQVSPRLRKALADVFYYTGYISNEMKVPTLTSRYWFNFVAMDVIIKTNAANIPNELLENIKYRWSEGVTILHHHTTWDFDQTKENWEVSIINA